MSERTYRCEDHYMIVLYRYTKDTQKTSRDGASSLPQAFDELVDTVKPEAILSGVANIHRYVLRVELILRRQ